MKIDGIVLTEHDIPWDASEISELFEKTKAWNLKILIGQELRGYLEDEITQADILAFGFYRKMEGEHSVKEIVEKIHEEGGVALAAHPYREKLGLGDEVYRLEIDGIEVLTPNHMIIDTMKAERAWKELKIAGIGGSDAHRKREVGRYLTHFEDSIRNEADLVTALKTRRCRPITYQEAVKLRGTP
jgi:hypothetical protein